MLVAFANSYLLMPAALTLLGYHYLCLWRVRSWSKNKNNKDPVNLFSRKWSTWSKTTAGKAKSRLKRWEPEAIFLVLCDPSMNELRAT